jgi:hypothetical protein
MILADSLHDLVVDPVPCGAGHVQHQERGAGHVLAVGREVAVDAFQDRAVDQAFRSVDSW